MIVSHLVVLSTMLTLFPQPGGETMQTNSRPLMMLCIVAMLGSIVMPDPARGAGVPQLVSYQGRLADADGQAPPTGDYTLSFSIYDDPVAAPCSSTVETDCARRVWGPQVFDGVPVVKGFFSVILGPHDTNGDPIVRGFTSAKRYLEVTIEDDEPVLPRQQVLSAPFALVAQTTAYDIPVGGIIMYVGSEAELPENWKICNGQTIDDPESPYHQASLPDLQGLFVRGVKAEGELMAVSGSKRHRHSHRHEVDLDVTMNNEIRSLFWFRMPARHYYSEWNSEYNVLAVKRNSRRSHMHSGSVEGRTDESRRTATSVPEHMAVHYIIRIK